MAQTIIANRLTDGRTVFLKDPGVWVDAIDDARVIDAAAAGEWLACAKRDEAANLVVEPYLIDIGDDREPLVWREQIRAGGPTVLVGAGGAAVVRARPHSRSASAGRASKLRRTK
jgi:hypothetical protein